MSEKTESYSDLRRQVDRFKIVRYLMRTRDGVSIRPCFTGSENVRSPVLPRHSILYNYHFENLYHYSIYWS